MKGIQLPLPLHFPPRNPDHINFPLKSDIEVDEIRRAASKKFARRPRATPALEHYRAAYFNELN